MKHSQKQSLINAASECARKYQSPAVLNLLKNLEEVFILNQDLPASELGRALGDVILHYGVIGLHEHQMADYYAFWTESARNLKD